jgi:hypothetical protein
MSDFSALTGFEKLIVNAMRVDYSITTKEAERIVRKYLLVIRDINDTQDTPLLQAARYYDAHKLNTDPLIWLERNIKMRKATIPAYINTPMTIPSLYKVFVLEISVYNFNEVAYQYEKEFEEEPTASEIVLACQYIRNKYGPYRVSATVFTRYNYSEQQI